METRNPPASLPFLRGPCFKRHPIFRGPGIFVLLFLLGGAAIRGASGPLAVSALRLLELKVPETAELNDDVTLECTFDLGNSGAHLYCVKWYKDDHEFFRFTPDDQPPFKLFPVDGVTVDKERLSMTSVGLRQLAWNSSGFYRCEVSTEAPNFETVVRSAEMAVIGPPRIDPIVEGFQSSYSVGDTISGNCTSSKSNPMSSLAWFINGQQADRFSLVYYSPWPDELGLLTSRLGLHFRVEASHFKVAPASSSHPGAKRVLELRCRAEFRGRPRQRVIRAILYAPPSLEDQRPAKHEGVRGAASHVAATPGAVFAVLAVTEVMSRAISISVRGILSSLLVNNS
ncbi:uncharacterized protein LOC124157743 [Ischnura elegans]|uniref:uncharacterized protein LOC124157743 n=1 Tax=Ischnura elegans TaxID=197161 RepID=UPI001ED89430|nr:uncharacterized protein LOC124157743 [Ischnura elegans]